MTLIRKPPASRPLPPPPPPLSSANKQAAETTTQATPKNTEAPTSGVSQNNQLSALEAMSLQNAQLVNIRDSKNLAIFNGTFNLSKTQLPDGTYITTIEPGEKFSKEDFEKWKATAGVGDSIWRQVGENSWKVVYIGKDGSMQGTPSDIYNC